MIGKLIINPNMPAPTKFHTLLAVIKYSGQR